MKRKRVSRWHWLAPNRFPVYSEAPTTEKDELYPASDDEDDVNLYERRLRIETQAQRYLRGEPVILLSATLRGPFTKESGWKNPWTSGPDTGVENRHPSASPTLSDTPLSNAQLSIQEDVISRSESAGGRLPSRDLLPTSKGSPSIRASCKRRGSGSSAEQLERESGEYSSRREAEFPKLQLVKAEADIFASPAGYIHKDGPTPWLRRQSDAKSSKRRKIHQSSVQSPGLASPTSDQMSSESHRSRHASSSVSRAQPATASKVYPHCPPADRHHFSHFSSPIRTLQRFHFDPYGKPFAVRTPGEDKIQKDWKKIAWASQQSDTEYSQVSALFQSQADDSFQFKRRTWRRKSKQRQKSRQISTSTQVSASESRSAPNSAAQPCRLETSKSQSSPRQQQEDDVEAANQEFLEVPPPRPGALNLSRELEQSRQGAANQEEQLDASSGNDRHHPEFTPTKTYRAARSVYVTTPPKNVDVISVQPLVQPNDATPHYAISPGASVFDLGKRALPLRKLMDITPRKEAQNSRAGNSPLNSPEVVRSCSQPELKSTRTVSPGDVSASALVMDNAQGKAVKSGDDFDSSPNNSMTKSGQKPAPPLSSPLPPEKQSPWATVNMNTQPLTRAAEKTPTRTDELGPVPISSYDSPCLPRLSLSVPQSQQSPWNVAHHLSSYVVPSDRSPSGQVTLDLQPRHYVTDEASQDRLYSFASSSQISLQASLRRLDDAASGSLLETNSPNSPSHDNTHRLLFNASQAFNNLSADRHGHPLSQRGDMNFRPFKPLSSPVSDCGEQGTTRSELSKAAPQTDEEPLQTTPYTSHHLPSTPDTKQSSLPTPDFSVSVRSFGDESPSPISYIPALAGVGLDDGRLPRTQALVDAHLSNPWLKPIAQPIRYVPAKRKKRVSWADLDGHYGHLDMLQDSDTSGHRAVSPPPAVVTTEKMPHSPQKFGKHFATMASRHPGRASRALGREKSRLLLSASQLDCPSPAVNAMAEAFIRADADIDVHVTSGISSHRVAPAESSPLAAHSGPVPAAVRHRGASLTDVMETVEDDVSAVLDHLNDFLDYTDMDTELSKISGVGAKGNSPFLSETPYLGPASLDMGTWD